MQNIIRASVKMHPSTFRDQKRVSDPQELKLQTGVSPHGCYESNPGALEEQQEHLTAEPCL